MFLVYCRDMSPIEMQFLVGLGVSVVLGFIIGLERESRGKDAGISTHILVIGGSMLFSMLSALVDPDSTSRIASNIIPGIGFLGAGLILKEGGNVHNLTTAASLWFSAAIGMAIGFQFYTVAAIAGIACMLIPRIPGLKKPA